MSIWYTANITLQDINQNEAAAGRRPIAVPYMKIESDRPYGQIITWTHKPIAADAGTLFRSIEEETGRHVIRQDSEGRAEESVRNLEAAGADDLVLYEIADYID